LLRPEIEAAISRVCDSQHFILGPEVEAFEEEIAAYCGCRFALGVSSGTDALLMALMALGVGAGDEVITSPFSFFATAGSIARLHARPVFVDIEAETYNIDSQKIEQAVSPRTKAIIPVHLFGQCAEMDEICRIAAKHGLGVIEDAAQAIGAEHERRRAGSMGRVACFSFFPSKNLGGFGDGGLLTTNDELLYARLKALRIHGQNAPYVHRFIGGNFRLDALQAAVLRVKLRYLEEWTKKRQANAARYVSLIEEQGFPGVNVFVPRVKPGKRHVFNQFVISCARRDQLRKYLLAREIGVQVYYPVPLHRQECFVNLGYSEGDFPQAERAAQNVLALPIYPELTVEQICYVVEQLKSFYGSS
jgi:dTDP-4-amino-4,6-dideoxygalactose transaminase